MYTFLKNRERSRSLSREIVSFFGIKFISLKKTRRSSLSSTSSMAFRHCWLFWSSSRSPHPSFIIECQLCHKCDTDPSCSLTDRPNEKRFFSLTTLTISSFLSWYIQMYFLFSSLAFYVNDKNIPILHLSVSIGYCLLYTWYGWWTTKIFEKEQCATCFSSPSNSAVALPGKCTIYIIWWWV